MPLTLACRPISGLASQKAQSRKGRSHHKRTCTAVCLLTTPASISQPPGQPCRKHTWAEILSFANRRQHNRTKAHCFFRHPPKTESDHDSTSQKAHCFFRHPIETKSDQDSLTESAQAVMFAVCENHRQHNPWKAHCLSGTRQRQSQIKLTGTPGCLRLERAFSRHFDFAWAPLGCLEMIEIRMVLGGLPATNGARSLGLYTPKSTHGVTTP